MSLTAAQKRARNNYKQKVKRYEIQCYPTEPEIIAKLEAEKGKGGYVPYIKDLIRADIAKK